MSSQESILHRDIVTLEDDQQVQEWTQFFGVSESELRAAIETVGNSEEKVREHLANRVSTPS